MNLRPAAGRKDGGWALTAEDALSTRAAGPQLPAGVRGPRGGTLRGLVPAPGAGTTL